MTQVKDLTDEQIEKLAELWYGAPTYRLGFEAVIAAYEQMREPEPVRGDVVRAMLDANYPGGHERRFL
jgi:hypothetical protein